MQKNKVNLFIVGAAKAGTTSIYSYLSKHPEINMSIIKEPHYFSDDIRCKDFEKNYKSKSCFDQSKYFLNNVLEPKHIAFVESLDNYHSLFNFDKNYKYFSEASTGYLFSKKAAQNIYNYNKNAKIIISLSNPIERAFSHFLMDIGAGVLKSDNFLQEIDEDYDLNEKGWGKSHLYIELGLYYEQVKRYYDIFPKENIIIIFQDGLLQNSTNILYSLFDFLNIQLINIDTSKKENVTLVPKNVKYKLKSLLSTNKKPKLSQYEYDQLRHYFKQDLKNLEKLINIDLKGWYE